METIGEITVYLATVLFLGLCALGLGVFITCTIAKIECQKDLPRTQVCKMVAVPTEITGE